MPKEYSIEELNEYVSNLKSSSQPTPTTPSDKQRSPLQSGLMGISQGATFGLADEAIARLESIRSGRPYEDVLQEARGMYRSASEQNPASYLTGEIGAGVVAPIGPSASLVKMGRSGLAAPVTSLGKLATIGAGTGALSGLGYSEGKDVGQVAKDVGIGGLLGGSLPVLGRGIAKGVQSLKPAADEAIKTSLTGFTGKTRAFLDQIEKNPEQVKRIESKFAGDIQQEILPEINAKINDFMAKNPYKQRAIQGSQRAIESIPDDVTISRNTGEKILGDSLKELEKDTVSATAQDAKAILNDYLKRFENTKEQIPGREIKRILQNLDGDIEKKFGGYGNPFSNDEASKAIKGLRFAWDNELKTKVPDYEKIMKKVRRDASASESLTNRFATKEGVSSGKISAFTDRLLKQQNKIMNTPEIKTDLQRIEAISRMPQSDIGLQTLRQDIQDIGLKKAIESRGNQGSNIATPVTIAMTALGGGLGQSIGGTTGGFLGGGLGGFLGNVASRQLEQRGGKIAESVLRGTKGIRTPTAIPEATQRGFQAQQGLQRGLLDQFLTENAGEVRRKREMESKFQQDNQNRVGK
jgi:hypothetical protein